ncbi:aminopeptidase [Woeseia oceani]|nr:aminopeptidase [Woeseia oceani]
MKVMWEKLSFPWGLRATRYLAAVGVVLLLVMQQGCYYVQATRGQLEMWRKERPVQEVIGDPATAPELASRLQLLQEARDFASDTMLLPDNDSYRGYADLERDYVLWNVIAAPEFSLQPKTWCYVVVGCLGYRGYFARENAEKLAAKLKADGYDVFVGGVPAYSTLGKFDDPLLNTMLTRGDTDLVALLFHELAHQQMYIKDDTAFNESFATAVAELGVQRWHAERGSTELAQKWLEHERRNAEVMALFSSARDELQSVYQSAFTDVQKRARKQQILSQLLADANAGRGDAVNGTHGELNNARLAAFAMYSDFVPAFRAAFANCKSDWQCFYWQVERLADLPYEQRRQALARLSGQHDARPAS